MCRCVTSTWSGRAETCRQMYMSELKCLCSYRQHRKSWSLGSGLLTQKLRWNAMTVTKHNLSFFCVCLCVSSLSLTGLKRGLLLYWIKKKWRLVCSFFFVSCFFLRYQQKQRLEKTRHWQIFFFCLCLYLWPLSSFVHYCAQSHWLFPKPLLSTPGPSVLFEQQRVG